MFQTHHEWLYFVNENEKSMRMIMYSLRADLKRKGHKVVYDKIQNFRIYNVNGRGVQIIYYKDILLTYRKLKKDPLTKVDFDNIKERCKQYPPSPICISVTYLDSQIHKEDISLRKDIDESIKSVLMDTLKPDILRRIIHVSHNNS